MPMMSTALDIRLKRFTVCRENGCHEWLGHLSRGYPSWRVNNRTMSVARSVYELNYGPIPPGHVVCHTCDNPKCVNPLHLIVLHLIVALQSDNVADMVLKLKEISARYGVCYTTARSVANGFSYRDE